jgi:hypothetical protein
LNYWSSEPGTAFLPGFCFLRGMGGGQAVILKGWEGFKYHHCFETRRQGRLAVVPGLLMLDR